jgi:hypothetical protein
MEAEACRAILPIITSAKISNLVTDGDVSLKKILRISVPHVKHLLDIGHAVKSFVRKFNAVNGKAKNIMKPFGASLVRHFRWLTKAKLPIAEKKSLWQNCLAHFRVDHMRCSHPPSARQPLLTAEMTAVTAALADFINSTEYYFDILDSRAHTQMNESVNAVKGLLAGKG